MAICNNCGATVSDTAKFCSVCGTSISMVGSQKKAETDNRDIIDKTIDDWAFNLVIKGDENIAKNNIISAIKAYKRALKFYPEDANLKYRLQEAENMLNDKINKLKNLGKLILKIVVLLLFILFGIVKYMDYKEKKEHQAYLAELERERAKKELLENNKVQTETVMYTIHKALSSKSSTDKYLTDELKSLHLKALDIQTKKELYGKYVDTNIWTGQKEGTKVSISNLRYKLVEENMVLMTLMFYEIIPGRPIGTPLKGVNRCIEFKLENGSWLVDDIKSIDESWSLKQCAKDFIEANK